MLNLANTTQSTDRPVQLEELKGQTFTQYIKVKTFSIL